MTELNAGRDLDALVAEKVMGQQPCDGWHFASFGRAGGPVSVKHCGHSPRECYPSDPELPQPQYSKSIAAAWLVVEKMNANRYFVSVYNTPDGTTWVACCGAGEPVEADTAPLAICRAALRAVGASDA